MIFFFTHSKQNIKEQSVIAMEKLRTELEAQHQASVNQMKSLWCKEKEMEIQLQVKTQVVLAKAAWKEEQQKVCIFLPLPISWNLCGT